MPKKTMCFKSSESRLVALSEIAHANGMTTTKLLNFIVDSFLASQGVDCESHDSVVAYCERIAQLIEHI